MDGWWTGRQGRPVGVLCVKIAYGWGRVLLIFLQLID